jgi:hypothetical protein
VRLKALLKENSLPYPARVAMCFSGASVVESSLAACASRVRVA